MFALPAAKSKAVQPQRSTVVAKRPSQSTVDLVPSSRRLTAARWSRSDWEVMMKIDSTIFGAITIDGTTYEHDVVVRLSGEVVKRKKKLSKKLYGTSHVLSKGEAKFLFEKGCDQVVIGSGQMGNVHLSPEAEAYFERKGCEVVLKPTPEAIGTFNRSHAKRIGLFHVTC
jgi:hypothetical protein